MTRLPALATVKCVPVVPALRLQILTFLIGIHAFPRCSRVSCRKYCLRLLYRAEGLLIDSGHNALTRSLQYMNNTSLPLTHIVSLTYLTHFLCPLVLIPQLNSPLWTLLGSLLYAKHI